MTSAELTAACRLLYGDSWQSALARDIARERETVNRWATGKYPIPKAVIDWLEREFQGRGWNLHNATKGTGVAKETE